MPFDFSQFVISKHFPTFGRDYTVMRPGVTVNFCFALDTPDVSHTVADAIEAYIAFVPPNVLESYAAANGEYAPLTQRVLTRHLKKLRATDAALVEIDYHQGDPGDLGLHAMLFESDYLDPELSNQTNLLRLEFPYNVLQSVGMDRVLIFVEETAGKLPFQSGFASYAFRYLGSFENDAEPQIAALLPRYLAIDPSYEFLAGEMRDHTPDAHWITFLSHELLGPLGGNDALLAAVPGAEVRHLENGVMIRAAKFPPIGDVNRQARDIGCLPDLARFMLPTRYTIDWMYHDGFDTEAWLARYDERDSEPWENG